MKDVKEPKRQIIQKCIDRAKAISYPLFCRRILHRGRELFLVTALASFYPVILA